MIPSVIIPAKNAEHTIRHLLESLLTQTYRPLEIIIVEGNSYDELGQIGQQMSKMCNSDDLTLRLFDETQFSGPLGPWHARNIGIMHSKGDYLIFLGLRFCTIIRN